jgi:anti-sigma factor RsiW
MNHPKPEELTDFLYDELDPARRDEIADHLKQCDACAGQMASWRSVRKELADWRVPMREHVMSPRRSFAQPLKWAAAAIIFLGAGYAIAHVTSPRIDQHQLRAELAKELRTEVRQELASEMQKYSSEQLAQQSEFQQSVAATINRFALQHATLRKDVETVALRTQEEFERIAAVEHSGATGAVDR